MPSPVSVVTPQRRREKDPLMTIAKGLSIAQSVFGIKSAMEQADLKKLQAEQLQSQQEQLARVKKGDVFQSEIQDKFVDIGQSDTLGAFKIKSPRKFKVTDERTGEVRESQFITKKEADKFDERQAKLVGEIEKIKTTGPIAKTVDALSGANQLEILLNLKTPKADEIAKRFILRLAGDARPSDRDILAFGSDPAILEQARAFAGQKLENKVFTPGVRAALLEATNVIKGARELELTAKQKSAVKSLSNLFRNIDPEFVEDKLNVVDLIPSRQEVFERAKQAMQQPTISGIGLPGEGTAKADITDADAVDILLRETQKPRGNILPQGQGTVLLPGR